MTRRNRTRPALCALLILACVATGFCVCALLKELYVRGQGQSYYTALSTGGGSPAEMQTNAPGSVGAYAALPPSVDFAKLRGDSPAAVAWIRCRDTVIDYPVVQGTDNTYYLSHLPDGTANKMGSIFLDYRNAPDFTDKHSVLYGHYLNSGKMFSSLAGYGTQAYFDQHPTLTLHTPQGEYVVELFACYIADSASETLPLYFEDTAAFQRYVAKIRRRSAIAAPVEVGASDRLITLCTCTGEYSRERILLTGRCAERP